MATGSDLTLTIPRDRLGEFIGSLLGQQRKIERSFEDASDSCLPG